MRQVDAPAEFPVAANGARIFPKVIGEKTANPAPRDERQNKHHEETRESLAQRSAFHLRSCRLPPERAPKVFPASDESLPRGRSGRTQQPLHHRRPCWA